MLESILIEPLLFITCNSSNTFLIIITTDNSQKDGDPTSIITAKKSSNQIGVIANTELPASKVIHKAPADGLPSPKAKATTATTTKQ